MTLGLEIDHVQVAMPKGGENIARAFYGQLLGLTEIAEPMDMTARGGCWFATAQHHQIHLGVDIDFRAPKKAHIALSTGSLNELRARLDVAGYKTIDDSPIDGRGQFFTEDPFGNRIEFMDRTVSR